MAQQQQQSPSGSVLPSLSLPYPCKIKSFKPTVYFLALAMFLHILEIEKGGGGVGGREGGTDEVHDILPRNKIIKPQQEVLKF